MTNAQTQLQELYNKVEREYSSELGAEAFDYVNSELYSIYNDTNEFNDSLITEAIIEFDVVTAYDVKEGVKRLDKLELMREALNGITRKANWYHVDGYGCYEDLSVTVVLDIIDYIINEL